MDKVKVITQVDFYGKILNVYGFDKEDAYNNPKFLGKEVADIIEYQLISGTNKRNVSKMIENVNEYEKIKLIYSMPGKDTTSRARDTQEMWFITIKGLISVIESSRKININKKELFINILKENNLLKDDFVFINRIKEKEFLDKLEESLKPFNIKGIKQYSVLSYRIDYYIPDLNIAIEYDENNHNGYSYDRHEGRQLEIENDISCKFIRVSDDNTDEYNIGYVIKNIFYL